MTTMHITQGFKASNNEAEYEALLAGFRMANDLVVKKFAIHSDSQLITSTTPNWQSSIIDYLVNDTLPTKRLESRKLQIKAAHYYMWNDILA